MPPTDEELLRRPSAEVPGASFVDVGGEPLLTLRPEMFQQMSPGLDEGALAQLSDPSGMSVGVDDPDATEAQEVTDAVFSGIGPGVPSQFVEDGSLIEQAPPVVGTEPTADPGRAPLPGDYASEVQNLRVEQSAQSPLALAGPLVSDSGQAYEVTLEGPGLPGSGGRPAGAGMQVQAGLPIQGIEALESAEDLQAQSALGMSRQQALEAAAQGQFFDEQAMRDQILASQFEEATQEHLDRAKREVGEIDSLLEAMSTARIDPNRMWRSQGEGARFAGAIAIAANVMATAMNPNVPMVAQRIIETAIDRDLQAQLADQQSLQAATTGRMNLLQSLRQIYSDETSALQAARLIKQQEATNRLEATVRRSGDQVAIANLQGVLANIRAQGFSLRNEMLRQRFTVGLSGDRRVVAPFAAQMADTQVNALRQGVTEAIQQAPDESFAQPQAPAGPQMSGARPQGARPRAAQAANDSFDPRDMRLAGVQIPQDHPLRQQFGAVEFRRFSRAVAGGGAEEFVLPVNALGQPAGPGIEAKPMAVEQARGVSHQFGSAPGDTGVPGLNVADESQFAQWRNTPKGQSVISLAAEWDELVVDPINRIRRLLSNQTWTIGTSVNDNAKEAAAIIDSMVGTIQGFQRNLSGGDAIATDEAERLASTLFAGDFGDATDVEVQLRSLDNTVRRWEAVLRGAFTGGGGRWTPPSVAARSQFLQALGDE
jgi:hypothetical protein